MAVCISSPWPYLLPLVLFTIACCAIAIPGLIAPIQISFHRRDVTDKPSPNEPSSPADGISRVKYSNVNIRERNRDARGSHKHTFESDSDRTSRLSGVNNDNIVSHHRRRNSRTRYQDFVNVELSESERTSTASNLVLSKPNTAGKTRGRTQGYVTTGNIGGKVRSDDVRTGVTSQFNPRLSVSVGLDNNDGYLADDDDDMDDEADEDSDDAGFDVNESRSKKEANTMRTKEWPSLQRLAELATISNPELGFINLITPNPDLDITIEVVTDEDDTGEDQSEVGVDNRLPGGDVPVISRPEPRPGPRPRPHPQLTPPQTGKETGRRKGKAKKHENRNSGGKHVENPARNSDNSSRSTPSFIDRTLLHLIRQTDLLNKNDGGTGPSGGSAGDWSPWSACTVSCGGGKRERTRLCGLQCRTTETQECNKRACADSFSVASEDDVGGGISPSTPQFDSNQTFPITQVFHDRTFAINQRVRIDVVDELPDVISSADFDSCDQWMECRSEKLMSYLSRLEDLPSCPCDYPASIVANNAISDPDLQKSFLWIELDPETARLDIYRPTAVSCIQSLLSQHSTSLASQQCCYDADNRLITRGQGAGTPQLISAEISLELNYKIDVLPWIICKGDWTKYHRIRPPNNGRDCRDIPDLQTFIEQFEDATNF